MNSQKHIENYQELNKNFYNTNSANFINNTLNIDLSSVYQPFIALLKPNSVILDAGCGSGRDTRYFLEQGFKVDAFDASEEMVKRASEITGIEVQLLTFQEMTFENKFDGIWACASLLHVSKEEMYDVFQRLCRALRQDSILYLSFKYGNKEEIRHGRLFNDYDEASFEHMIRTFDELKIISMWKTTDIRKGRESESWLNVLLKKS